MIKFNKLGLMIDCSRNSIMKLETLKHFIDLISKMGYNIIQLYTEDTYEVTNEPYFGYLRGRFSKEELIELDSYTKERSIELIPCIQTLAHLGSIFRWDSYKNINDFDDILLVDDIRTYELIENMFKTLSECFTSRTVNIGMDEAHMIGLGKYLDKYGYNDRFDIMINHLNKVVEIGKKYGFNCMIWSDMFFRLAFKGNYYEANGEIPLEVISKIPKDLKLIYWDYYSVDVNHYNNMIKQHQKFDNEIVFAGGVWTWTGLIPHNKFSMKASKKAIESCINNGIKEIFFTMWGDNGGSSSPFSVLPTLYSNAMLAQGITDEAIIKAGFLDLIGVPFDEFLLIDSPNDIVHKNETELNNPSKYLLYNDILLGFLDTTIPDGISEKYKSLSLNLKVLEKYENWAFLFNPPILLSEVLELKSDLGIKTRELYKEKDKVGISKLLDERFYPLLTKIDEFYDSFVVYWDNLFEPHGFDVIDIRIGGLVQRIKHTIKKLNRYIDGEVDFIKELEEELLDFFGGTSEETKKTIYYNKYQNIATINNL